VTVAGDAEQALLSGLLLARGVAPDVAALLEPMTFHDVRHQLLFSAMLVLASRSIPLDPVTLGDELRRHGDLDRAGGMEYVAALIDVVPTADHVVGHARLVRDHARRRELAAITQQLAAETDLTAIRTVLARAQTVAAELGNATASRFRLLSITELLALPAPAWLLNHYLPANGLSVLYGAPGSGKSFLGIAWAMSVATGQPWIDCTAQRGNVLYVGAEGGSGLGKRIEAYTDSHELAVQDGIHFVHEAVNLLEPRDVDALLAGVAAVRPTLLVFDTMARCMAGGDENSAMDVGLVIAATDRIRRATNAAVLMIHHTQKTGELERGSSALRGAADAMFVLENDAGVLTLKCSKQKDAAPVEPRQLRLVAIGSSCVIEPEDSVSASGRLEKMDRLALESLNAVALGEGATYSEWRDAAMENKHGKVSMSRATFTRCRKRLIDAGLVRATAKGKRYLLTGSGISASVGSGLI
jgi:hypothetical protein